MTALQSVVDSIEVKERTEATAALKVYREAVGQLANEATLSPAQQKKLAESLDVLGLGTADLSADVETLRARANLGAALIDPKTLDAAYNDAAAALSAHIEAAEKKRIELAQRVFAAEGAMARDSTLRCELNTIRAKNPRLFGTEEAALSKPQSKPPAAQSGSSVRIIGGVPFIGV